MDRCIGYRAVGGTDCPRGCQAQDIGYDCNIRDRNCHMMIVCAIVVSTCFNTGRPEEVEGGVGWAWQIN